MQDLHKQALADAKALSEVAKENARNVLLEYFTPVIKDSVASALGNPGLQEADEEEVEEPKDEKEDEKLEEMPMPAYEARGGDEEMEVSLDDLKDDGEPEPEEKPKEEAFEITTEDIQREWAKLKNEVMVSKGFKDQADPNKEEGNAGLSDEKAGEHHWNTVEPPASQDYSMKEAKKEINKYQGALRLATKKLAEQAKVIQHLHEKVTRTNLFNHKFLYVTKLIRNPELDVSFRKKIVESMDAASNLAEVKLVYSTYANAINNLNKKRSMNESRRVVSASRATGRSSTLLTEGAEKDEVMRRQEVLAGLINE